ncbi:hypothetical protein LSAT2_011846 [Lamellibrachia satsuma]|nr:hypothetical protein LSAT2_011846 [Lamellibrachia satsuma]
MMPGNLPMSPNSLPPSNKPGSPYYPFTSKRPSDDSLRGRGGKFTPEPKRRKTGPLVEDRKSTLHPPVSLVVTSHTASVCSRDFLL